MKTKLISILSLLSILLSGCSLPEALAAKLSPAKPQAPAAKLSPAKPQAPAVATNTPAGLKRFMSVEELSDFLSDHGPDEGVYYRGMKSLEMFASMDDQAGTAKDGAADWSSTNVQVADVDEADMVKSDGRFIYSLSGRDIVIAQAVPAKEASILSRLSLASDPENMYVVGDRLVAFGTDNEFRALDTMPGFRRHSPFTFVKVFDITDRRLPKLIKSWRFEGWLKSSRRVGNWIYFVNNAYSDFDGEGSPLPRIMENDKDITCLALDKCPHSDFWYFDMPYQTYQMTSLNAINIQEADPNFKSDYYLASSDQEMYMSKQNLYLSAARYTSREELMYDIIKTLVSPYLSAIEKKRIDLVEQADPFILSRSQKEQKIKQIITRRLEALSEDDQRRLMEESEKRLAARYQDLSKELEKTEIYRFEIKEGDMRYSAKSSVPGRLLNQFSMDEHDGYFRLATTRSQEWLATPMIEKEGDEQPTVQESYSNLYILDKDLAIAGRLEGLAKGERIYSVRFLGKRAFIVTFKQTDPLFAIDLSNPKSPRVAGELKVPGHSDYLHPYSDKYLVGVGYDAIEDQHGNVRNGGVKISLFDVSDLSHPIESDRMIFGESGSYTEVANEHKSFLASQNKNLVVLPLLERSKDNGIATVKTEFAGAVVLGVEGGRFRLRGRISHEQASGGSSISTAWTNKNVRRSLYIGDVLYTISNEYLKANRLTDMVEERSLLLSASKAVTPYSR